MGNFLDQPGDFRDLKKQATESWQILRALTGLDIQIISLDISRHSQNFQNLESLSLDLGQG
jgi:hypothetical protein